MDILFYFRQVVKVLVLGWSVNELLIPRRASHVRKIST